MEKHIKGLSYQQKSVGKRIKSSKKANIWTFSVKDQIHKVELYVSKFSGKRTLKVNDEVKYVGKQMISEPVYVTQGVHCFVYSNGKNFQISINGVAFDQLRKTVNDVKVVVRGGCDRWEDKARPLVSVRGRVGNREKFPIRKNDLSSLGESASVSYLMVPSIKPRSSSNRGDTLKCEFTNLLD